jgi:hypothetical protein
MDKHPKTGQRWPDGINPYIDPDRREAILEARRERAAELERWKKGAGKAYLAAFK